MRTAIVGLTGALALLTACATISPDKETTSARLDAARNIVDAVNAKNSDQYVRDLADDVTVVMYHGEVRLRGRDAVEANRKAHFQAHPQARNELVHLVEIDDRVVMHDQVWLSDNQTVPADIVEVFTFSGDKIIRIDVIQPSNLFGRQLTSDDPLTH